jgi:hypothetical protein
MVVFPIAMVHAISISSVTIALICSVVFTISCIVFTFIPPTIIASTVFPSVFPGLFDILSIILPSALSLLLYIFVIPVSLRLTTPLYVSGIIFPLFLTVLFNILVIKVSLILSVVLSISCTVFAIMSPSCSLMAVFSFVLPFVLNIGSIIFSLLLTALLYILGIVFTMIPIALNSLACSAIRSVSILASRSFGELREKLFSVASRANFSGEQWQLNSMVEWFHGNIISLIGCVTAESISAGNACRLDSLGLYYTTSIGGKAGV